MQKATLTLRLNTTAARTFRVTPDITGKLLGIHYSNVSFTSDIVLNMFRSSSTHKANRILKTNAPHGTTQVMWRPRFTAVIGGSTGKELTKSTGISQFNMMEFVDQPLVIQTCTAAAPKGTTLICTLTAYLEGA